MLQITATELPRFMACNGSWKVGGALPPTTSDETARREGDAAHWLIQQLHSGAFTAEELVDRAAPNGVFITGDMLENISQFLADLSPSSMVEQQAGYGTHLWHVNGRADAMTYNVEKRHLTVSDYKHGWSIVEPEMNWTLLSHVFGFMATGATVRKATLKIYQPRPYHPLGNVREWTIDDGQIMELWTQLRSTLDCPADTLNTSAHCRGCRAMATCPASRKAQMNAIDASEMLFSDDLDNARLSFTLDQLKRAGDVLAHAYKAYSELAEYRISQGQIVDNYTVEPGRANRSWLKHVTPDILFAMTGKDLARRELITPAQAEKKGVSKETVDALTERPSTGPKLVRVDAHAKASKMFGGK